MAPSNKSRGQCFIQNLNSSLIFIFVGPNDWAAKVGEIDTLSRLQVASPRLEHYFKKIPHENFLGLSVIFWVLWRILCLSVIKSSLDNIRGPTPDSFLNGNLPQLFNPDAWDYHRQISAKFGGVIKIKGLLGASQLYVFDTKALHHIVVKDQHIYEETPDFLKLTSIIYGPGIFSSIGEQHKKQRKMLSPVFSNSHMRQMLPIFRGVSEKLRAAFMRKVRDGPQEIDVLHWMSRTALELIGQSGLGYSFDPLTENALEHPFSRSLKMLLPVAFKLYFWINHILTTVDKIGTPRFRRFVVDLLPWPTLHDLRDIIDTMHHTSVEIIESKKQALKEGDGAFGKQLGQGKDIIGILMRENMKASDEDRLSEAEMVAQVSSLTFAAMDTTSGALSRLLHLLSQHPDVQEKLRLEIVTACEAGSGEITYDELVALPYMDAVCRETLRLHPPSTFQRRQTGQNIVLPLENSIRGVDGRELHEVVVPRGTIIIASILSANNNPDIWGPDSYEWKPERWLSPLPDKVLNERSPGIYSHMMTFWGGGRACLGFKFSQLEMKVVLSTLLETFRLEPSKRELSWNLSLMTFPTVKGGDNRPELPLVVTML